jgi:hypothetical protein
MKKLVKEFHSLAWTLAGTGLVLITLSGDTRTLALWISGVTLVVHIFGVLISKED